jgi:hypothetical protein
MSTIIDWDRLRSDVNASDAALDDTEAEEIFTEAGEEYTGTASIKAATRVIAIDRLLASSAKLVDYSQDAAGSTSEKMSQVFDHLLKLRQLWKDKLDAVIADEALAARGSAARFGRSSRRPARIKEHPGDGGYYA